MNASVQVAAAPPPAKAVMIYDGDCDFCSRWVRRWQYATGDHLDYLPSQDARVAARFPNLPRSQFENAVQLVEPDGRVYSGAEAIFRALAHKPRARWLLGWYQRSPGFARASEWGYRFAARHRRHFSALTRKAGRGCRPVDKKRR